METGHNGRAGVEEHEGSGAVGAPSFQVYGLELAHKHTPEIQRYAGLARRPIFVPAYGSFRQGIVLTVPLDVRLVVPHADAAALHACLARHYAAAAHVHVLPLHEPGDLQHLDPQALNGTDDMRLSVFSNMEHGHVLLSAVFDNLGKGAAGAAVQNLNLMLAQ